MGGGGIIGVLEGKGQGEGKGAGGRKREGGGACFVLLFIGWGREGLKQKQRNELGGGCW